MLIHNKKEFNFYASIIFKVTIAGLFLFIGMLMVNGMIETIENPFHLYIFDAYDEKEYDWLANINYVRIIQWVPAFIVAEQYNLEQHEIENLPTYLVVYKSGSYNDSLGKEVLRTNDPEELLGFLDACDFRCRIEYMYLK